MMTENNAYISRFKKSEQYIVDAMMPNLPDWIEFDDDKRVFKVIIEPFVCQKCGAKWYPRIKANGQVVMPKSCAKVGCRNKLWWRDRD